VRNKLISWAETVTHSLHIKALSSRASSLPAEAEDLSKVHRPRGGSTNSIIRSGRRLIPRWMARHGPKMPDFPSLIPATATPTPRVASRNFVTGCFISSVSDNGYTQLARALYELNIDRICATSRTLERRPR
jgi:hypothetical protein